MLSAFSAAGGPGIPGLVGTRLALPPVHASNDLLLSHMKTLVIGFRTHPELYVFTSAKTLFQRRSHSQVWEGTHAFVVTVHATIALILLCVGKSSIMFIF